MIYGDTISFTSDFTVNRAIVAEYLIWDIMAQLECPTGHAVLPLPVTESYRIPAAQEIVDAQIYGRQLEQAARRLWPYIDFSAAHEFSRHVVAEGKAIFSRALEGLKEAGVDISDPVQLLYVLKMIGPALFEEMLGIGRDGDSNRDKDAGMPTDIGLMALGCINENRKLFQHPDVIRGVAGKRMLIASTDVHEQAIRIIAKLLSEAGADMIYLGAEKDPREVAADATAHHADLVLISTHNGMALQYAHQLKEELVQHGSAAPVIMGGVLNQKLEGKSLPVDVSDELKQLGFRTCTRLSGGLGKFLE
jgi:methylmalonyl-CoA mutase cobalamin-binding domain/chain